VAANCVHFQLAMLAYNLNCWLAALQTGKKTQSQPYQRRVLQIIGLHLFFPVEEQQPAVQL